jgi:hypothetical protein
MTDLDTMIDAQHRQAQAAEDQAVQVVQRMRRIEGIAELVDKMPRRFGQAPNPYAAGSRNLTVSGMLERHDPALAQWLANQAGASVAAPDYAAKAEAEARADAVDRLRVATEQCRLANQAATEQRYRRSLAPMPTGWRRA